MSPKNGSRRAGDAAADSVGNNSATEPTCLALNAQADIAGSNSLADLAARINAEHEAASAALNSGLQHAIATGELLLEAKAQIPHGQWLPWLKANCTAAERTAQAYMRVARSFGKLDDGKSATVADLSFRDALNSLASTGLILKQLPSESYDRVLASVADHDHAETWRHAVRRVRLEDMRARYSLETPPSMLPSAKGRKIRVARNSAERKWMLAIGPNISRAALIEKEEAARASPGVHELQLDHAELLARAAALEAEAKSLREEAALVDKQAKVEIKKALGPVLPFTETYDFQADEETDAELAGLPQRELVNRLLAARGTVSDALTEIDRGYWGDMRFMSLPTPGPFVAGAANWTRIGSPEWLDELFPNWNQPKGNGAAAAVAEVRSS